MNITQGDSGTIIVLDIVDKDNKPIDLTDCSVIYKFKPVSGTSFEANAQITDNINGKTRYIMTSTDLSSAGKYEFQATVIFPNTNKFSTKIMNFKVDKKL